MTNVVLGTFLHATFCPMRDYFDEDRLLLIQSQYEGAYKKEVEIYFT